MFRSIFASIASLSLSPYRRSLFIISIGAEVTLYIFLRVDNAELSIFMSRDVANTIADYMRIEYVPASLLKYYY